MYSGLIHRKPPISIHAPLAGSDGIHHIHDYQIQRFLSTLPSRGATCFDCIGLRGNPLFLSTLPSRGATAKTNKPLTYFCMEMTKLSVPLLYKR